MLPTVQTTTSRTVCILACLACTIFMPVRVQTSDLLIFKKRDFLKTEKDVSEDFHHREKRQTSSDMDYLVKYGYVKPGSLTDANSTGNVQEQQSLSKAILQMQKFLGLPLTGEFDERTRQMMKKPRCANRDNNSVMGGRSKRYTTVGSKWKKLRLTYSINNFTPKIGRDGTHQAIDDAFRVWATHAPLEFVKVMKDDNPDIVILFAKGYHNDNTAFDGEGGYLAHAYYPGPGIGGDTHFDAEEPWTINKGPYEGNDLFLVAVHELGHALGLGHSPDTTAIMAPVYQYHVTSNFQLPQDDIKGIQLLYGVPSAIPRPTPRKTTTTATSPTYTTKKQTTTSTTTTRRTTRYTPRTRHNTRKPSTTSTSPKMPDVCDIEKFDAMSFLRNEFYVFSSKYMWRKSRHDEKAKGPYKIGGLWPKMSTGVDVVFEKPLQGTIVMIKGKNYYEFDGTDLLPRFPRRLKSIGIAEENLDAGIWWHRNKKSYLFKGDQYWRMDGDRVDSGYPKNMEAWPDIPNDVDAAFIGLGDDGLNHTYFVKGNTYWKFHSRQVKVIGRYDSFAQDWLGCKEVSLPAPPVPQGEVSGAAIAAVSVVVSILLIALGVYLLHHKRQGYKHPPTYPQNNTPPPPYTRGYHTHIEEGDNPDERYVWVKTFHHGWNNLKFSLQQKV